jgi:hypothetical protein
MAIRFMLQPVGEAYWMVAGPAENGVLNDLCSVNCVTAATFDAHGCLPVAIYRGARRDMDRQKYVEIEKGGYRAFADRGGSQFDGRGNARAAAPLLVQRRREWKMAARPYQGRFVDLRLRGAGASGPGGGGPGVAGPGGAARRGFGGI